MKELQPASGDELHRRSVKLFGKKHLLVVKSWEVVSEIDSSCSETTKSEFIRGNASVTHPVKDKEKDALS